MHEIKVNVMGSATLILVAIGLVVFVMRARSSDAQWAQRILTGLANGRTSIERHIDWEHLKTLDVEVGATYAKLPSDQDRRRYRQAFIQNFAKGFAQSGARPEAFVNWRIQERGDGDTLVAADYPAKRKTLLVRIARDGGRRLEALQWQ